ncbi:MAG TPA: SMI1/KNR4 family protein [Planctomycetota bacterium]
MKPDEFLHAARGTCQLGRPLPPSERARWKARHPSLKLPNDLLGFLKRANGITFSEGRLLPLREIRPATEILYQDQDGEESLPETWLGLTDDVDGLLVLDIPARTYLVIDEETEKVGDRWEEALDWLYARYLASAG